MAASAVYTKTMTGNETIAPTAEVIRTICFLNPNGADRNFDPINPTNGYEIIVVNKGNFLIVFDSSGINQGVGPGQKASFCYDLVDTSWH